MEGGLVRAGESSPESRVNFDIRTEHAPVVGLAVDWPLSASAHVRVSGSFASTDVALHGGIVDERGIHDLGILGGFSRVFVSTVDAAVMLSLGASHLPVIPYAVFGGGATIYDISDSADLELMRQVTGVCIANVPRTEISPALVLGLGAKLLLGRAPSLRVELTRHFSTGPLSDGDLDTSAAPDFAGVTNAMELVHQTQVKIGVSVPISR